MRNMFSAVCASSIVNLQSSLHENVVFSVCACMCNVQCMWNSIFGLDTWYYSRFNINCGVAVAVKIHVIFKGRGGSKKKIWRGGPIFKVIFIFEVVLNF